MLERSRQRREGGPTTTIHGDGSDDDLSSESRGGAVGRLLLHVIVYGMLPPIATGAVIWFAHAEAIVSGPLGLGAVGAGFGSLVYIAAIGVERWALRPGGPSADDGTPTDRPADRPPHRGR